MAMADLASAFAALLLAIQGRFGPEPRDCEWNGQVHENGETWTDDCNTCSCIDGTVGCTKMLCPTGCESQGQFYHDGDSWAVDCNTCFCSGTQVACTEMACASGCSVEQLCANTMEICWDPGSTLPCGMCQQQPAGVCAADRDCPSSKVCGYDPSLCLCEWVTTCIEDCREAPCAEGQTCGSDGHCATTSCGAAEDCPPNFRCDAGGCLRKACQENQDCEGYCVNSRCYDEMGYCAYPPP